MVVFVFQKFKHRKLFYAYAVLGALLFGMLAIFFFAGVGNASTFKQMPMIFERRQAGGVIGWTSAIAAYGPFIFGMLLSFVAPPLFFALGAASGRKKPERVYDAIDSGVLAMDAYLFGQAA